VSAQVVAATSLAESVSKTSDVAAVASEPSHAKTPPSSIQNSSWFGCCAPPSDAATEFRAAEGPDAATELAPAVASFVEVQTILPESVGQPAKASPVSEELVESQGAKGELETADASPPVEPTTLPVDAEQPAEASPLSGELVKAVAAKSELKATDSSQPVELTSSP